MTTPLQQQGPPGASLPLPIVGMDLGTSSSSVCVFKNGRVETVLNEVDTGTTPSVVAFTDTGILIGDAAKVHGQLDPYNTVYEAPRMLGLRSDNPFLQSDMRQWPFKVIFPKGRLAIEVTVHKETRQLFPEQVCALIIQKLKHMAERALSGQVITDVVLSAPASFNAIQRDALIAAAGMAGLRVLHIITESTTAALALAAKEKILSERQVLVYHLGGGHCSVSLLTLDDGVVQVRATAGDPHLGGEDFDTLLVEYCLQHFAQQHNGADLRKDPRALRRLRFACEKAKCTLASVLHTVIEVDNIYMGERFSCPLSREQFEEISIPLFQRCLRPIEKVIQDTGAAAEHIQEVLLVGGSTRICKVQDLIRQFFGGHVHLCKSLHLDEAAAFGATLQAAILANVSNPIIKNLLLIDVLPLNLSVLTTGDALVPIVRRNTAIPCTRTHIFTTANDNQEAIRVQLFEGDQPQASQNTELAVLYLRGIKPAPRGIPRVALTVEVGPHGQTVLTAADTATGNKERVAVVRESRRRAEEDAKDLRNQGSEMAIADVGPAAEEYQPQPPSQSPSQFQPQPPPQLQFQPRAAGTSDSTSLLLQLRKEIAEMRQQIDQLQQTKKEDDAFKSQVHAQFDRLKNLPEEFTQLRTFLQSTQK